MPIRSLTRFPGDRALLIMISGGRALRFDRADESAIVFCGSQKSVVSGIPMASALIAGPALGLFVFR